MTVSWFENFIGKSKLRMFLVLGVIVLVVGWVIWQRYLSSPQYQEYLVSKGLVEASEVSETATADPTGASQAGSASGTTSGTGAGSAGITSSGVNGGSDALLARKQESLNNTCGQPRDGFIWADSKCNVISLGLSGMSAEDVAFAYLRAFSTNDPSMVQRLSRGSATFETYSKYFDSTGRSGRMSYQDQFKRDALIEGILSIKNKGVTNSSVYASNQHTYTFEVELIDFTYKDFLSEGRDDLFDEMYKYDVEQSDLQKAHQTANDYILNYYRSGEAKTRTVNVTLTVEKYPDINTGWLVSMDKDLNDALTTPGNTAVNEYVQEEYRKYKQERMSASKTAKPTASASASESSGE